MMSFCLTSKSVPSPTEHTRGSSYERSTLARSRRTNGATNQSPDSNSTAAQHVATISLRFV